MPLSCPAFFSLNAGTIKTSHELYKTLERKNSSDHLVSRLAPQMEQIAHTYKINLKKEGAWQKLATRLADDFLPGFWMEYTEPYGRRITWEHYALALFRYDVEQMKTKSPLILIGDICKKVANRPYWRELFSKDVRSRGEISAKVARTVYLQSQRNKMVNELFNTKNMLDLQIELANHHAFLLHLNTGIIHPLLS